MLEDSNFYEEMVYELIVRQTINESGCINSQLILCILRCSIIPRRFSTSPDTGIS